MNFTDRHPAGVSGDPEGGEMDIVASHQRALLAACLRTRGPILELGVGWYSTPLLHEIGCALRREVITVDNNPQWLNEFMPLACEWHSLHLVGWWGELGRLPLPKNLSVVFVDNGQPAEREYAVRSLLSTDLGEVFVMHDTEEGFAYGYDRLLGKNRYSADIDDFGLFKYQWTDYSQKAWTTIASNKLNVGLWGLAQLPHVEPSRDIT